jgi:hypothetical protein
MIPREKRKTDLEAFKIPFCSMMPQHFDPTDSTITEPSENE